jgi:hypothetical protein
LPADRPAGSRALRNIGGAIEEFPGKLEGSEEDRQTDYIRS